MKKLIKIIGIIVVAVFALLIAAAVAVTLFFDPNDYKDDITAMVKEKTGRELTLDGKLSLSFFPWVGLEVGKAELGNAPGFGNKPFASVQEVGVKVKLLPLLHKQVVMDTVILKGLQLNLARNRDGRGNWEGLGGKSAPAAPAKAAPAPKAEGGTGIAAVQIDGVKVSDAHISWDDAQSGQHLALDNLNLSTGALGSGGPVDLDMGFDLVTGKDARPRRLDMSAKVALDPQKQSLDVSDLDFRFAGLELTGNVVGTGLDKAPAFKGKIKLAEFVPRRLLQELQIEPPETADATVLGKASMETAFTATTHSADLTGLVLRLDDTTLRGNVNVRDFNTQAVNFKLDVDDIDVDRYLPPPKKADAAAAKPAASSSAPAQNGELIPVELLRKLNLNGSLKVAKLKAFNLRSEDVNLTLVAQHGNVRLHPATAKLYGGGYDGDVRIDARGKPVILSMDEKLHGVQAEPLFKDLAGWDWVSGTANLNAQLTGNGVTMDTIRSSLRGLVTFAFTDGSIKGVNIPYMIRKANAALHGEPAPPSEPEKTDFTELKGSATVKDGVVSNRDLVLNSPLLRVTGEGTADLVREQIDYLVKATLVATLAGQGGASLEKLKGVPIPVRIKGSFQKPGISVDLAQAVTEQQKQRVEKKVEKVKEKAREELKDKLKGLFGK